MNTTTVSKWTSFGQGLIYVIIGVIAHQLTIGFGAGGVLNGTLPPFFMAVVPGLLSIVEQMVQDKTGKAMFGFANTSTTSLD